MGWDMNRCLSCLSELEVLGSGVRLPEGYSAAHKVLWGGLIGRLRGV